MEKMAFLGPLGTHSEAAAVYLNSVREDKKELVPYPEIFAAVEAVAQGEAECALVPGENSLEGSINVTLDELAHGENLVVVREMVWSVHNQLMAKCSPEQVKEIYSHAQPLAQCRGFLQAHYPQARLIQTASTAQAATLAAEAKPEAGIAAICTARAGELYGLKALAKEIQDNNTNCTRFYEVRRGQAPVLADNEAGRSIIVFQIDGSKAGALWKVLKELADRNINMTRIESRPARTGLGEYIFFLDLEVEPGNHKALQSAIEAVRARSSWLKELGEFTVMTASVD